MIGMETCVKREFNESKQALKHVKCKIRKEETNTEDRINDSKI
jgi:hypothetical protein